MKRMFLVASLAVAAAVVVPASASAALNGTCAIHGTATFSAKLSTTPNTFTYSFSSEAGAHGEPGVKCVSKEGNTYENNAEGAAKVTGGEIKATCTKIEENKVNGAGELSLPEVQALPFTFKVGVGGEGGIVEVHIIKEGFGEEAKGLAEFFTSGEAEKCVLQGVNHLKFNAVITGELH